jgi:hypothetical protein
MSTGILGCFAQEESKRPRRLMEIEWGAWVFGTQPTTSTRREEGKIGVNHREERLKELLVLKCDPSSLEIGKNNRLFAPHVPVRGRRHPLYSLGRSRSNYAYNPIMIENI